MRSVAFRPKFNPKGAGYPFGQGIQETKFRIRARISSTFRNQGFVPEE